MYNTASGCNRVGDGMYEKLKRRRSAKKQTEEEDDAENERKFRMAGQGKKDDADKQE